MLQMSWAAHFASCIQNDVEFKLHMKKTYEEKMIANNQLKVLQEENADLRRQLEQLTKTPLPPGYLKCFQEFYSCTVHHHQDT